MKRWPLVVTLSLSLVGCGGKIRDDDDADGAPSDANDAVAASPEVGTDSAIDTFEAGVDAAPITAAVLVPHAVALIGVTTDDVAIVRDDSGNLVAAPVGGSAPQRIDDASSTEARVFGHVAFSAHGDGTLIAWSLAAGRHVISSRSSIVGAVASDDGAHVAWLETHDGFDDFHVASTDGSGALLVSSVKSSTPCVHARAGAVGRYAVENACAVGSTGYHALVIDLDRSVVSLDVPSTLSIAPDLGASSASIVLGSRQGILARLDGTAQQPLLDDAQEAGVFLPDGSAILTARTAANEMVRVDTATGTVRSLGVTGSIAHGDVSPNGALALVYDPTAKTVSLVSTDGSGVHATLGPGVPAVTGEFLGAYEIDASFTVDGAFALFTREDTLRAVPLTAGETTSSSLSPTGARVGWVRPSRRSQVAFSVDGASKDLFVTDASTPSGALRIGSMPASSDFALTLSRRGVVWIEASGGKAGLNVAPLP